MSPRTAHADVGIGIGIGIGRASEGASPTIVCN